MGDVRRVAVVGAGIGGLAASVVLAAYGWETHLFDAHEEPGGKAGSLQLGRFRFDTGPSLITRPDVFRDLFRSVGLVPDELLRLDRLPVITRYFFADGSRLDAHSDPGAFAEEVERATDEPRGSVMRFLEYSGRISEAAGDLFLRYSLHEPGTYLSRDFRRALMRIGRIDPFRSMSGAIASFFRERRVRQLFERYATYNGSDPYRAPATFNLIPHAEYVDGAYTAEGGVWAVPRALAEAARVVGVRKHLGTPVDAVLHEKWGKKRRVLGISAGGEAQGFHAVVSNADVAATYRELLGDSAAPELARYEALESSSSVVVFYWGMNARFSELDTHNVFFSEDYRAEFTDIFERLRCPRKPTVYVNITSKTTPGDAPPDGENWFVLVNSPYDAGQEWDKEVERTREAVLDRLRIALGVDVERFIEEEDRLTPPDVAQKTASHRGALYGIASNTRMAAFKRHPNRNRRYLGLYHCGGSVHPGGGMPLALMSGRIAAHILVHRETR